MSPGGMPINWTERKCGHVSTTHNTATVERTALYKTRRGSQYRRASATECLKSFTLTSYQTLKWRQVLYEAKLTAAHPWSTAELVGQIERLWNRHPVDFWLGCSIDQKQRLQRTLFPEGLKFSDGVLSNRSNQLTIQSLTEWH